MLAGSLNGLDIVTGLLLVLCFIIIYQNLAEYLSKDSSLKANTLVEGYTNGNYYYSKCSKYRVGQILEEIFRKHGINSDKDKSNYINLYLPCGYTTVESELENLTPENKQQLIFGITGCDSIVSKNNIWKILLQKYGRQQACQLMPPTYLSRNDRDLQLFQNHFKNDKVYILKKNVHRQTGLKLCNNLQEILHLCRTDKKYAVIQEMLQNPLLVNGRKINLRVYILVICHGNKLTAYRYNDGFIYYTPKKYARFSTGTDENITTGYISREVYSKNPLTHQDLSEYLEKKGYNPETLYNNIDGVMDKIIRASAPYLCTSQKFKDNQSFQLFGVDIAPDGNLDCRLIEINKGPDMGAKDQRDHNLKFNLQEDIFNLLGVLSLENNQGESKRENGFIKFLELNK